MFYFEAKDFCTQCQISRLGGNLRDGMAIDEEKLIIEVQKYTTLYDPRDPFYKDINKKEKIWGQISQEMGVSGKLLKQSSGLNQVTILHRNGFINVNLQQSLLIPLK